MSWSIPDAESVKIEVVFLALTAEGSLDWEGTIHTPIFAVSSSYSTVNTVPFSECRALGTHSVDFVEIRNTLANSIHVDLVWLATWVGCVERWACFAVKWGSIGTFYATFANKVESLQAAAGSSVPFGIGTA